MKIKDLAIKLRNEKIENKHFKKVFPIMHDLLQINKLFENEKQTFNIKEQSDQEIKEDKIKNNSKPFI